MTVLSVRPPCTCGHSEAAHWRYNPRCESCPCLGYVQCTVVLPESSTIEFHDPGPTDTEYSRCGHLCAEHRETLENGPSCRWCNCTGAYITTISDLPPFGVEKILREEIAELKAQVFALTLRL